MVGTVKWKVQDNKGKVHNFILPNTYYSSSVETRLLSPQHWAQVRGRKRDTCCITYYDAIIMRWNKDKYQITAPLDDRKHRNVGVMRSVAGIKNYLTSCRAFDQQHETIAFPATTWIDKELGPTATHDEMSDHDQPAMEQNLPSISTQGQLQHMREEPREIILEYDTHVDEEQPIYANDKQEYMTHVQCQGSAQPAAYQQHKTNTTLDAQHMY